MTYRTRKVVRCCPLLTRWLFTVYNKDEMDDLTVAQRKMLKEFFKQELDARRDK